MKRIYYLSVIVGVLVLLMSAGMVTSSLTNRSKEQIVLHESNMITLTAKINNFHSLGYRVTSMVAQSIAYDVSSSNSRTAEIIGYIQRGEVIVIMER